MRRRILFFGFIVVLFSGFGVTRADWVLHASLYDDTFLFEAVSTPFPHHVEFHFNVSEGEKAVYSFNGTGVVEFWICDQVNYDKFKFSTEDHWPYTCFSVFNYNANITTDSGEFQFPTTGAWYFVFVNEYTPSENQTITFSIDQYVWERPYDPFTLWGPPIIGFGAFLVVALVLSVFLSIRKPSTPTT